MREAIVTTSFGRRPVTLGQIRNQLAVQSAPDDTTVNKWQVFQNIRDAREVLGATDRSLAILNALLTFHREVTLTLDGELVVWPSNEQLMARANGMPAATLRRHLAILVDCGLIIRRDSPNGKRFARKGRGGEIEQAYGFDLSPIVMRAEEFCDLAAAVEDEKRAFRVAKERLTLLRRDIVKLIETGIEECVPGNWGQVTLTYQTVMSRLPRTATKQILDDVIQELHEIYVDIRDVLETFIKSVNPSANESHYGRHIQNSKPDSISESENGIEYKEEAGSAAEEIDNVRSLPRRELPLGVVLDACPSVRELAQGGEIRHWRDFLAAVELARPMLGISPSAWREALEALGEQHAAITLAAIYQRADQINNAGGYIRILTERARAGKFSTWPMIMALLRSKLDAAKPTANAGVVGLGEVEPDARSDRLLVSGALLKSLQRPRH